eukprot:7000443-Prymnesium_polylepis.1
MSPRPSPRPALTGQKNMTRPPSFMSLLGRETPAMVLARFGAWHWTSSLLCPKASGAFGGVSTATERSPRDSDERPLSEPLKDSSSDHMQELMDDVCLPSTRLSIGLSGSTSSTRLSSLRMRPRPVDVRGVGRSAVTRARQRVSDRATSEGVCATSEGVELHSSYATRRRGGSTRP